MSDYKIYIPTRNSGAWIDKIIRYYQVLNINPVFIADSRSNDDTINILKSNRADYFEFLPEDDYAEAGMVEFASKVIGSKWLLRLDDDELPSKRLISQLDTFCSHKEYDSWAISRREVFEYENTFVYSRWPSRIQYFINNYQSPGIIEILQPFPRLYRLDRVKYINKVHTAGYTISGRTGYADNELFIVHFQGLVKTPEQRLEKVRKYADIGNRFDAWSVTDEYLPEYLDKDLYDFSADGMDEFQEIFESVKIVSKSEKPRLTSEEEILMNSLLLKSSLKSRRSFNEKIILLNNKIEAMVEYDGSVYRFIPKKFTRVLSELLNTLSRLFDSHYLKYYGDLLWKIDNYRKENIKKKSVDTL